MKTLEGITFKILTQEDVLKRALFEVTSSQLYDSTGERAQGGVLDPRFGAVSNDRLCQVCFQKKDVCIGHQGYLDLEVPVLHPGYFPLFEKIFKGVCMGCKRFTNSSKCAHCNEKLSYSWVTNYMVKDNTGNYLDLEKVYKTILAIPQSDYGPLFTSFYNGFKLKDLFIKKLLVPSITIRPNLVFKNSSLIDDLTRKLQSIVLINQRLKKLKKQDYESYAVQEQYNLLGYQLTTYMDNTQNYLPQSTIRGGKTIKSIVERLERKEGLLRGNLRGKRTNYSARAVITPDCTIEPHEVGLSYDLIKQATLQEKVINLNITRIKEQILKTTEDYQTVFYYKPSQEDALFTGKPTFVLKITPENKQNFVKNIAVGGIIQRSLKQGDWVVLNRAPTLHKYGLMAHKVVAYKKSRYSGNTIGINPAVVTPYNADFDGDEMQLHIPQSIGAQTDVKVFMGVDTNLVDLKSGRALFGIKKELVTAGHIFLKSDRTFTCSDAIDLLGAYFNLKNEQIKEYYTSKEIFSMILPSTLTLDSPTLKIEEGQFVEGQILKSNISKDSFFMQKLNLAAGPNFKMHLYGLIHLFKNAEKYIENSICYSNFNIPTTLQLELKEKKQKFEQIGKKNLSKLSQISKKYQLECFQLIKDHYTKDIDLNNFAVTMAKIGSSGSLTHLVQMINLIGPRYVQGKTPQNFFESNFFNFTGNALKSQLNRIGQVWNSYSLGLSWGQMECDWITARDNNILNQVKIVETGYFSRRLLCALSDLFIQKDNTVRDYNGNVIQSKFGGSGLNLTEYKPHVQNPGFAKLIKENYFREPSDKELKGYSLSQLKKINKLNLDSGFYEVIKINTGLEKTFTEKQFERICTYLHIPHGYPIGMATGHAIGQPATQMTLSSKHELSGAKSPYSRLSSLVNRMLVAPTVLIKNYSQNKQLIQDLFPKSIQTQCKVAINTNDLTIELKELSPYFLENMSVILKKLQKLNLKKNYKVEFKKELVEGQVVLVKLLFNQSLELNVLYNLYKQIKKTFLSGNRYIEYYTREPTLDLLCLRGAKGSAQLYKYMSNYMQEKKLKDVVFLDPVYLQKIMGIEAARKKLYLQLTEFKTQGLNIDLRYFSLFADLMAHAGFLTTLNRAGVIKGKDPLTRMTFEATKNVLYDCLIKEKSDNLTSPISSILLGKEVSFGTSKYKILF